MTREDQFIGRLEGYLDDHEGHTPLPAVVRDAVRAQIPTTRQVSARSGSLGRLNMSLALPTPARYGLLAAVVVAAAALGVSFLSGAPKDDVGTDPTPSPQTPSAPSLIQPEGATQGASEISAGRYYVEDPFPVHVSFDVAENATVFAYTSAGSQVNVALGSGGEFSLEIVNNISADPCTGELLDPPPGPYADNLVTALSNLPDFEVSPVTAITVSGYQGKQLTLTAPSGADAPCSSLLTWKTTTRHNGVGRGEINEVQVLDVDGVRLLICIAYSPRVSSTDELALRQMLDSVQIGQ